jgi:uncharacterized protein YxeA
MKKVYIGLLVVALLVIVAFGSYEAFNASSGGALIQLSASHVPTPEDIHNARVYGMNNQEDDDNKKDAYNGTIDGMFQLDNSPYGPY